VIQKRYKNTTLYSDGALSIITGVGASKFLGVQRIFAQIFPNLPKKFLCNFFRPFFSVTFQKMVFTCFFANVGGEFFEVKQRWAALLPKFSGIFSRNLGILFGFSGILPKFSRICPNFRRFCPNFQQINFFGGALAPPAPPLPKPPSIIHLPYRRTNIFAPTRQPLYTRVGRVRIYSYLELQRDNVFCSRSFAKKIHTNVLRHLP